MFTSSWGQLESTGSNIGDLAVFASQMKELGTDFDLGAMSGDPARTASEWGAAGFSTRRGRLFAMLRGVLWSDAVIVGGGELVQDSSSLLYSQFNLLPFRLAAALRKPSFAWLVGLGQAGELRPWTPGEVARCLRTARGISVRDEPSWTLLRNLGFRSSRVMLAADSAFCLCGDPATDLHPGRHRSPVLGAAPRDTTNRRGSLLPLETRRRLGLERESPDPATAGEWAALLDRHLERNGGRVLLLPFHTGSLSNSDDVICRDVLNRMRHRESASIHGTASLGAFLEALSGCRVVVTAPLHGAILSVVTGALPVAVPYSSKGSRFMAEAGLSDLVADASARGWGEAASELVETAWRTAGERWEPLARKRAELRSRATANTAYFRSSCAM